MKTNKREQARLIAELKNSVITAAENSSGLSTIWSPSFATCERWARETLRRPTPAIIREIFAAGEEAARNAHKNAHFSRMEDLRAKCAENEMIICCGDYSVPMIVNMRQLRAHEFRG